MASVRRINLSGRWRAPRPGANLRTDETVGVVGCAHALLRGPRNAVVSTGRCNLCCGGVGYLVLEIPPGRLDPPSNRPSHSWAGP